MAVASSFMLRRLRNKVRCRTDRAIEGTSISLHENRYDLRHRGQEGADGMGSPRETQAQAWTVTERGNHSVSCHGGKKQSAAYESN